MDTRVVRSLTPNDFGPHFCDIAIGGVRYGTEGPNDKLWICYEKWVRQPQKLPYMWVDTHIQYGHFLVLESP